MSHLIIKESIRERRILFIRKGYTQGQRNSFRTFLAAFLNCNPSRIIRHHLNQGLRKNKWLREKESLFGADTNSTIIRRIVPLLV